MQTGLGGGGGGESSTCGKGLRGQSRQGGMWIPTDLLVSRLTFLLTCQTLCQNEQYLTAKVSLLTKDSSNLTNNDIVDMCDFYMLLVYFMRCPLLLV